MKLARDNGVPKEFERTGHLAAITLKLAKTLFLEAKAMGDKKAVLARRNNAAAGPGPAAEHSAMVIPPIDSALNFQNLVSLAIQSLASRCALRSL